MSFGQQELSDLRAAAFSIAYRMLGSVAETEDIVQESLLRLHRARTSGVKIASSAAYVGTIATRLAIDHLRSARVRRESYVGTWLPEPVVEETEPSAVRQLEMAESLSIAFLRILESLSPVERAIFLLKEVFGYSYPEIAPIVEKSEENCRQIFARAKAHIEARKPRFEVSEEKHGDLVKRFVGACQSGDLSALMDLLAADVTFYGDGGGKATALLEPLSGPEPVARHLFRIFARAKEAGFRLRFVRANGQHGAMIFDSQERLVSVITFDIVAGTVRSIWSVLNPDKLAHLGRVSDLARIA